MPKGPQEQPRPADAIGCAVRVAEIATGEIEEELTNGVAPGRKKSGKARGGTNRGSAPRDRQESGDSEVEPMKTYNASDIARYFLSITDPEDNDVSNLKLQKLSYYAQGLISAMRNVPLFSDTIEAWEHGPVVPNLYHTYKQHGSSPIPIVTNFDESLIDEADRSVLDDIYDFYGQYSPWRLREMTHEERPWLDAYHSGDIEIPVEGMVEFFRPIIKEEYIAAAYGAS